MTEERTENRMQPGAFDDDRLLALALGLDDDPELLAAAGDDAELARRLEAMRADVALIGAQVAATVPAPDEGYTDLSGDRWSGLKEFFQPPTTAAKPRRERRWWRVVAPVTALLVLALIVGVVAVNRGGMSSSSTTGSAEVARSAADDGAPQPAATAQDYGASAAESTTRERIADQLDRFAVIVLARARQATGALQRFAVLRIFKGDVPQVVELEVDDKPADEGRLHLLMLDPVATTTAGGSPEPIPSPDDSPSSPEPIPSLGTAKDAQGLPGKPLAVAYTYGGEPTMVRELDAGTDPASVSLPIP
jgi:hypothetical protein